MNHQIELLQEKDIASYKELIDECFGISNEIEKYQVYSQNNNYQIFVIKLDGVIAGSVTQYKIDLFTFDFQPCLMLFNVAVRKDYRKDKLATELFEHIISQAKKDGYKSISLTCMEDAYPAHKLYESIGFTRTNSVKFNLAL